MSITRDKYCPIAFRFLHECFVFFPRYGIQRIKKDKNTASVGSNSVQNVTQTNSMSKDDQPSSKSKDDQPISLVRKAELVSIDLSCERPVAMVKNISLSQARHENHMIYRSIYHNPVTNPREQL